MTRMWAPETGRPWAEDWQDFLAAADYEADRRGGNFDVWDAMGWALRRWLDAYEGVAQRPVGGEFEGDILRNALVRLLSVVPEAGIPGGARLGAVLESAISQWSAATEDPKSSDLLGLDLDAISVHHRGRYR